MSEIARLFQEEEWNKADISDHGEFPLVYWPQLTENEKDSDGSGP